MELRRVALIAYHSSPLQEPGSGDAGGMTVYVRALSQALARRRIRTDIFTRATGDEPLVTELFPGVRVVSLEAGPRTVVEKNLLAGHVDDFIATARAFSTAQRARYDIVHSHYWQSGLAARRLAPMWDAPHVHSHHTLGRVKNERRAPGEPPEPERRLRAESDVIAAADMLVASAEEEWNQLSCLYRASHDRLRMIYPGVDHRVFAPGDRAAARRALRVAADDPVMLYVGRIQPLKGLDLAVRALCELVPALERPVTFLVVGGESGTAGAEELNGLEELAVELGVGDRVRFLGPKPHAELTAYYRAADVAVVCSHTESFGLAALEAQACGTPVVATDVGGLKHIVRDGQTGYLVEGRDPADFAGRLKTVLADEELRHRMGSAAIDASNAFSWDRTAEEFVELYECLLTEDFPEACTC